jgi:alkaline phosphatase/alkaline phosphatase D
VQRLSLLCIGCLLFVTGCGGSDPAIADGAPPAAADTSPKAGLGILVGDVTDNSAIIQVRVCQTDKLVDGDVPGVAGVVKFTLSGAPRKATESPSRETKIIEAVADHDFIARAVFTGLSPNRAYTCTTEIGKGISSLEPGPTARFETHPGAEIAKPISFVVVTGMNYAKFHGDDRIDRARHRANNNTELPAPYSGPDKPLGYPALKSILDLKPAFFIGTGDNVYYDTPTDPRAKTIDELRRKWHEQFVQPRYRDLFAAVPTYWEIDDHDFRYDDCDNSGDEPPTPELGKRVMLEQLPYAAMDAADPKTYRTRRVSRDLQIWLTENRWYRSPNAMEDGPEKTIWGTKQKEWLKSSLAGSTATFKILISPTPMIGPDDLRKKDNHCDVGGFQHERDEFFQFLAEKGLDKGGFYLVCGDRHWQYHAVHPTGIEEFSCGALVDANSRPGRKAGDPASTDAEGLIKQPYLQDPRSGGFLEIRVDPAAGDKPATLTFRHHDEKGAVLYELLKTPPPAE